MADTPVIKAEGLSFKYNESEEGIFDISFEVMKGEAVLITGNSGCGKSTLLKCLNKLIPTITEGELQGKLYINGEDYAKVKMYDLNKEVGSVFQNPRSQFFTENSTAELVFPMENYGMSKEKMRQKLGALKEEFGLLKVIGRDIFTLSSGERQLLALASSLTMDQKILIFDEPSANLDYGNATRLGILIDKLKTQGYTIIVADHRFYYLNGYIDKVLFMEQGRMIVFESEDEFKKSGYDTRSFDLFSLGLPFNNAKVVGKDIVAELNDISYKGIIKDINLKLYKHEVVGLVGSNGAGKTTLAKILCESNKPDSGKVIKSTLPFFIMQDPDYQLFGTSVDNELSLVKNDQEKIAECEEHLGLVPYRYKHPFDLSGGQKQRLQIAMALICDRDLIIFDEPTSGLDVYSMQRVSDEIVKLKEHAGVLVISHDYEFLRHVADRIIFLNEKTITDDFELTGETVNRLNEIFNNMASLSA